MDFPPNLISNPEISKVWEFPFSKKYLDMRKILREEYIPLLNNYYNNGHSSGVGYQTFSLVGELTKNAYYHGEARKNGTTFGVFLSPNTAVVGCNDGGDYFKKREIKESWEKRLQIPSGEAYWKEDKKVSGHDLGHDFIYSLTTEIFIDTNSGTFFGKFNPLR